MRDGTLPRAKQGAPWLMRSGPSSALLGTSTVTAYIEAAPAGPPADEPGWPVSVAAVLFVLALFVSPLVKMVGGGHVVGQTTLYSRLRRHSFWSAR